jgi:DNA-binding PadR family transcriptional regulator
LTGKKIFPVASGSRGLFQLRIPLGWCNCPYYLKGTIREIFIHKMLMYLKIMYLRVMNKSSLYKGCLEPIIMRLLQDNARMYGYQITQMVKEITKGELQITEGALYPLLHRLEEQGIVETELENIGNRVRKYYTLTKAGKKQTSVAMEELKMFMQSLQLIVNPKLA